MTRDPSLGDTRIALLRGINVGRAGRVAMADLRALVADLGYRDVRTVLNSGNVVFTAPPTAQRDPAAAIGDALLSRLGVAARVFVLTASQLDAVIRGNPLLDVADAPSRLYVAFLAGPSDRAELEPLLERDWSPEALALGERTAYLWCPAGVIGSRLIKSVDRAIGDRVTNRTWATVIKIHAAACSTGGPDAS